MKKGLSFDDFPDPERMRRLVYGDLFDELFSIVRGGCLTWPTKDEDKDMELTRFDMQNQAIQRRIATALERIATVLEKLPIVIDEGVKHDPEKNEA